MKKNHATMTRNDEIATAIRCRIMAEINATNRFVFLSLSDSSIKRIEDCIDKQIVKILNNDLAIENFSYAPRSRHLSEETKRKIREGKLGDKNPNYGKHVGRFKSIAS